MRIVHLLASPVFSGPAELVLELALAQRALGHDVQVAVDRTRAPRSEEPAPPRFADAGLLHDGPLEVSVKSSPLAMLRDVRHLWQLAPDVLHAHFSHDHHLAALATHGTTVLVRSVHAPRSFGWATPRAHVYTAPYAALTQRLRRRKVPVLEHPALVSAGFRPGSREAARLALGVQGAPLVGLVSSFQPSRRLDVALEAFALLRRDRPGAHLVLAGDGELAAALQARAAADDLRGAVTFLGYRSGEAFVEVLQAVDQVWLLGLGNDFSGRAAVQAKACGALVLAVREGALAGVADALVEPTPAAVAHAAGIVMARPVRLPDAAAFAQDLMAAVSRVHDR
ncbi:MAG: glycosyltransferase [Myxococcaceae bacterium]|nr:glycosyltransferase [Myxococcaceae bacterium]